jgi:hypothetical protein
MLRNRVKSLAEISPLTLEEYWIPFAYFSGIRVK